MDKNKINDIIEKHLGVAYMEIMTECKFGDITPLQTNILDNATAIIKKIMLQVVKQNS